MKEFALIAIGFGLCALLVLGILLLEWLAGRPRRSRMVGAYFDARTPFAIVSRGPERGPERSEELIARNARRLHRIATARAGNAAGK